MKKLIFFLIAFALVSARVMAGSQVEVALPEVALTVTPYMANGQRRLVRVGGDQAQVCAWDPRFPVSADDSLVIRLSPVGRDPIWGEIREGSRLLKRFTSDSTDKPWEVEVNAGELAGRSQELRFWGVVHFGRGESFSEPQVTVAVQVAPKVSASASDTGGTAEALTSLRRALKALRMENERLKNGVDSRKKPSALSVIRGQEELERLRAENAELRQKLAEGSRVAQVALQENIDLKDEVSVLEKRINDLNEQVAKRPARQGVVVVLGAPNSRRTVYVWRDGVEKAGQVVAQLNARGVGCVMDIALPATVGLGGQNPRASLTAKHPATVVGERRVR